MKILKSFFFAAGLGLSLLFSNFAHATTADGRITAAVARMLEQGEYTRQSLNAELAQRFLKNYLGALDFNHLFFTQQDIDAFNAKYKALDDDLRQGIPDPAYDISALYAKRVEERVAWIDNLLKQKFDFNSDRTVELNRTHAPWPQDEAAADTLWRDRIEGELLQEKLNAHPTQPAEKIVAKRYDEMLRNIHELTRDDTLTGYLSTLAMTYDPHSEYMGKPQLDNFNIDMGLSLVGVGAVLHSEDGYAKVMELVPGGPAQREGHLQVGDRIIAVAQGRKDFVDVIGMNLNRIVTLVRGTKGAPVRLKVIPASAADPSQNKVVEIVRDEVKLKEQQAKAEVIDRTDADGKPVRLGWITLPSFYADMDHAGNSTATSATTDVSRLLNRLKQENINGLVIDLRQDGGGSLREAINLTGLFIKKGPVVQTRDSNGNVNVSPDPETSVAYDGPMIVLTNRLSASASEIFAGALQDYGRAVIVGGEHTFGKGTVQTLVDMDRYLPSSVDAAGSGALKLTIQKFYRISGGSTQLKGVVSDIQLPSPYDLPQVGEVALTDPMPYDQVRPASYEKTGQPLYLDRLRQLSAARVAADPEFGFLSDDLERARRKLAENHISLNEKVRRAELAVNQARQENRVAERAREKKSADKDYAITLDNVDRPELQLVTNGKKPASVPDAEDSAQDDILPGQLGKQGVVVDSIRNETLNILGDFVDLSRAQSVAIAGAFSPTK